MYPKIHRRAKGVAPVVCNGIQGRLADISRGGTAFTISSENAQKFVIGQRCTLSIKTPHTSANPEKIELQLSGEILHIDPDTEKRRVEIRMQFTDLSDTQRAVLNKIILFFVRNFSTLSQIEETIDAIPPKSLKVLNLPDIQYIFDWAISDFENLPQDAQQALKDLAQSFNVRFKLV
ncbi:PilZ domain-containing protein [Deltaproteobacteria bacterium TL4]